MSGYDTISGGITMVAPVAFALGFRHCRGTCRHLGDSIVVYTHGVHYSHSRGVRSTHPHRPLCPSSLSALTGTPHRFCPSSSPILSSHTQGHSPHPLRPSSPLILSACTHGHISRPLCPSSLAPPALTGPAHPFCPPKQDPARRGKQVICK